MNYNDEDLIKVKAYFEYCLFPSAPAILGKDENTFGIVKWGIVEELSGHCVVNDNGEATFQGEYIEPIEPNVPYTLLGKKVVHPKYGVQYQLLYINKDVDLGKLRNQKAFLKTFLTDGQIEELYKVYKDPLKIISEHDVEGLKKVHGIGDYIANCIINRFEDNKDWSNVYVELDEYGLTPNFIGKLVRRYRSPSLVIKTVKENPYQLCYDMDGVGFKTADNIALKGGLDPKSVERIKAFIIRFLEDACDEGHSYIQADELLIGIYDYFEGKENIFQEIDVEDKLEYIEELEDGTIKKTEEFVTRHTNNISEAIKKLQDEDKLVMEESESKAKRRVYLKKIYNLEKDIARHLQRLLKSENNFNYIGWEERVKQLEAEQGFAFDETQIEGIKLGLQKQVCFITGGAGCVDADTEFFTGKGWKRIADYKDGDKVLQWDGTGKGELVYPLQYVKKPCDYLYHFETKYGVSQTLCNEHRIIYESPKGFMYETNIQEIINKQNENGWRGRFLTTFNYSGRGIDLSDAEIRVMVAVIADGSFMKDDNRCRFHIKKQRKKDRLKKLFHDANIELIERPSAAEGYNDYYAAYVPRMEKEFSSYWYNCNENQMKIIYDELIYWDGNINTTEHGKIKKRFTTTIKSSADFVQFMAASIGIRSTIHIRKDIGRVVKTGGKEYIKKTNDYTVIFSEQNKVGLCADNRKNHIKTPITMVPTIDGFKYCFTVPSGYLILRKDNKIFITGNCGKSSLVSGILAGLDVKSGKYSFAQTALSGRAAARLSEVTGEEGMTIHRLLSYNVSNGGFLYNSDNPLDYDIIILDELSLVGGEIFLKLIQSIPDGSKLIMLGDLGQLEAVGLLNLACDFYHDETIPTVELTKVHRQAARSGIISSSRDIRNQIQLFDNGFVGEEVLGELQDMILDIEEEKDNTKMKAIGWFKKYFDSDIVCRNIMDIQVIAPVKERGDACVYNLNTEIQKIINPLKDNETVLKVGSKEKPYFIHKKDKVMCVKNNYTIKTTDGRTNPIFNGWMGVVKSVRSEGMVVEFPLADGDIFIPRNEMSSLITLGYASTVHKMQGDQAKVIIGVVDYSTPPKMLTHELLYTLVTRAKKRCVLVGQRKAISQAINTDFVSTKRTFMSELLSEEYEPFSVRRLIYEDELQECGYSSEAEDEEENNEYE